MVDPCTCACIAACVAEPIKKGAKKLIIDKTKEIYENIKKYEDNLKKLEVQRKDLGNKKNDINKQVQIGEMDRLDERTSQARDWLESAGKKLEDEKVLKLLEEKQRRQERDQSCLGHICPQDLYCRYKMSREAKATNAAYAVIIQNRPSSPLTLRVRAADLEPMPGSDFMEGLKSREELLEIIMDKLTDDNVRIVGLFGMGGIGKSTLANEIASKRGKDLFTDIMMVEMSKVPNTEHIQDQIAEEINLDLSKVHSAKGRAKRIYNKLVGVGDCGNIKGGGRRLVILDNILEELDLVEVGIPHGKDTKCKLLITTRQKNVCEAMGAKNENILEVELLNDKEALLFFEYHLDDRRGGEDFKSVVKMLLKKFEGLPLAIETLAKILPKPESTEWKNFAYEIERNISSKMIDDVYHIYDAILETSYNLMDNSKKKLFFLLATLFPPGSSIPIESIMRYGIGLDLFEDANSCLEATEQANKWAKELISSALLSMVKPTSLEALDFQTKVKLHDVVRASAISIAAKQGKHKFNVEEFPRCTSDETLKEYTAISLMSGHSHYRLDGMKLDKLQILILHGSRSQMLPDSFFQGMKTLKVLVLSNMQFPNSLPKSITRLKNLKTLLLEDCYCLRDIRLIGKLVNLRVLSLRRSDVMEVPNEISNLRKLLLLDLRGCTNLEEISANVIGGLIELEVLYFDEKFTAWWSRDTDINHRASIAELNSLRHLKVLEMHVDSFQQLPTDIGDLLLENLVQFKIRIGLKYWGNRSQYRCALAMEEGIDMKMLIKYGWLLGLSRKTDYLMLRNIKGLKLLPHFYKQGIRQWKHLEIAKCYHMYCLISTDMINMITFQMLEIMYLSEMPDLSKICDVRTPPEMFPNLRELTLDGLESLQPYALPIQLAGKLTKVCLEQCNSLKFIFMKCDGNKTHDFTRLPWLRQLKLSQLPKLESILGEAKYSTTGEDGDEDYFEAVDYSNYPQPVIPIWQHQFSTGLFNAKIQLTGLEGLEVYNLSYRIEKLWDLPTMETNYTASEIKLLPSIYGFENLRSIKIDGCEGLESLGTPSLACALVHLERLDISNCKVMEQVIEFGKTPSQLISFPKLQYLKLSSLTNLRCFYAGSNELQLPALKCLKLKVLPAITTFVGLHSSTIFFSDKIKFPCLEELALNGCLDAAEVEELWKTPPSGPSTSTTSNNNTVPRPRLRELKLVHTQLSCRKIPLVFSQCLTLRDLEDVQVLFATPAEASSTNETFWKMLQDLEDLQVERCYLLEQLFENEKVGSFNEDEDEDEAAAFTSPFFCTKLAQLRLLDLPKLNPITNWYLFKNICHLAVSQLKWKYVFPADLVSSKGIEQLQLLGVISITKCDEIEAVIESDGLKQSPFVVFPKLWCVQLSLCEKMMSFSCGHEDILFPSLKTVEIQLCPSMLSFTSGRARVPQLSEVIVDCEHSMNELDEINSFLRRRSKNKPEDRQQYSIKAEIEEVQGKEVDSQISKSAVEIEEVQGKEVDSQISKSAVEIEEVQGKEVDGQISKSAVEIEEVQGNEVDSQISKSAVEIEEVQGKEVDGQKSKSAIEIEKLQGKEVDGQKSKSAVEIEEVQGKEVDGQISKSAIEIEEVQGKEVDGQISKTVVEIEELQGKEVDGQKSKSAVEIEEVQGKEEDSQISKSAVEIEEVQGKEVDSQKSKSAVEIEEVQGKEVASQISKSAVEIEEVQGKEEDIQKSKSAVEIEEVQGKEEVDGQKSKSAVEIEEVQGKEEEASQKSKSAIEIEELQGKEEEASQISKSAVEIEEVQGKEVDGQISKSAVEIEEVQGKEVDSQKSKSAVEIEEVQGKEEVDGQKSKSAVEIEEVQGKEEEASQKSKSAVEIEELQGKEVDGQKSKSAVEIEELQGKEVDSRKSKSAQDGNSEEFIQFSKEPPQTSNLMLAKVQFISYNDKNIQLTISMSLRYLNVFLYFVVIFLAVLLSISLRLYW